MELQRSFSPSPGGERETVRPAPGWLDGEVASTLDQILNYRNEGPPFQPFRWEILVRCKGMKTDTPERTPAQLQPQLYSGGRNSELKTLFITHNFSSSRIRTNLRRIKKTLPAHVSGDIE